MQRKGFIQTVSATIIGVALPAMVDAHTKKIPHYFELDELSITDLQELMSSGKFTSHKLVEIYLSRIAKIDSAGPELNAVLELNPDALQIAKQLDEERAQGKLRGPMHGIPVLIKGNIDTHDKMHTSCGATALENAIAPEDAFLVKQLRKAGAVVMGKTNLSEWANFRSTRSTSGWSSIKGQTKNPYRLNRSPAGSSAGSGVAVAANLCAVAVGTETDGSIVTPASMNGVVGIKPTVGLISRSGIIPISHTCDTAGPIARTVADAAILLSALAGMDEADAQTRMNPDMHTTDYTGFLKANGLDKARIGIARNYFGRNEEVHALMEKAIEKMKVAGAIFIELHEYQLPDEVDAAQWLVMLYEFKDGLNSYLKRVSPTTGIKSLKDIIAFNKSNAVTAMPFFKQEILELAETKPGLDSDEYIKALGEMKRLAGAGNIEKLMKEHELDAIVAPTTGPAFTIDLVNGDHFGGSSASPAAIAGCPAITVPMGQLFGLPVGISFWGRAYSEGLLIKLAYSFEQVVHHRARPLFLEGYDLT